jgi:hypothetical protein
MDNNPFLKRDQAIREETKPTSTTSKARTCKTSKCVKKTTDKSGFCATHRASANAADPKSKVKGGKKKAAAAAAAAAQVDAQPSSGPQLWTTALKKPTDTGSDADSKTTDSKTTKGKSVNFKEGGKSTQKERAKAKTADILAKKTGRMTMTATRQIILQTWFMKRGKLNKKLKNRLFKLYPENIIYYKQEDKGVQGTIALASVLQVQLAHKCKKRTYKQHGAKERSDMEHSVFGQSDGTVSTNEKDYMYNVILVCADGRKYDLFTESLIDSENFMTALMDARNCLPGHASMELQRLSRTFGVDEDAEKEAVSHFKKNRAASQEEHQMADVHLKNNPKEAQHTMILKQVTNLDDEEGDWAKEEAPQPRRRRQTVAVVRSLSKGREAIRQASTTLASMQMAAESVSSDYFLLHMHRKRCDHVLLQVLLALEGGADQTEDDGVEDQLHGMEAKLQGLLSDELKKVRP